MNYYNKFNLLNPEIYEDGGVSENCVLVSVQMIFLMEEAGLNITKLKQDICNFIDGCELQEGLYNKRHLSEGEIIKISHDNITSICAFSKRYGFDYHKKIWKRITKMQYNDPRISKKHLVHPRDMIFIGMLNDNIICKLLYPVLFGLMAWSCFETYKIRPQWHERVWTFLKTGKFPEKRVMIGSDAELLAFVRCYGRNDKISFALLKLFIHFNELKSFEGAFKMYYKKSHPLIEIIDNHPKVNDYLK